MKSEKGFLDELEKILIPLAVVWASWVSSVLVSLQIEVKGITVRCNRASDKLESEAVMYKSAIAHYKNKYPNGMVSADENSLDVFCSEGKHRVALRKNGAGQWMDQSEEMGCQDKHDLAPIPKDARVHKLYPNGVVGKSEESDEREPVASELAKHSLGGSGKVPSIDEIVKSCEPKASRSNLDPNFKWADYSFRSAPKKGKEA